MLHELLLVLLSHPSSLFVPFPHPPLTPATFIIRSDFPFLHQSEKAVLDVLAQYGWWYGRIVNNWLNNQDSTNNHRAPGCAEDPFDDKENRKENRESNSDILENKNKTHSRKQKVQNSSCPTYLYTFQQAVLSALQPYKLAVLKIEERILKSEEDYLENDYLLGRVSIGWIQSQLQKYSPVLKLLFEMKNVVLGDPDKHHGCKLLQYVYQTWNRKSGIEGEVVKGYTVASYF